MGKARQQLGYREVQVLAFTRSTIEREGRAPSYAMIRDALGMQDNGAVRRTVEQLERRRLVMRSGTGRDRRIQLLAYTI